MVKLFFIHAFLFLVTMGISKAQPGKICNWDNNKQAAVVLTFDDWSPGHYPIVVPELKQRGMVATFFPMISSIADWNHPWPEVIETVSYGNEMANHSATHPKLSEQTAEALSTEIRGAKTTLDENISTQSVISFDYPFGDYNDQVIDSVRASGHICGRGVMGPNNYAYDFATKDKDYFELRSYGMNTETTTETFSNEIEKVASGGGLLVYMYHSVDDAAGTYNDSWYAKVLHDSLQAQLDALLAYNESVWITTLGQAIKYHREANCATLSEIEAFNCEQWVLNLSDTLTDNDLYNQPLSLKVKMNGVQFNSLTQNGNQLNIDNVFNDTILFKAIPDAGNIILGFIPRDTILANNRLIEYTGRIDFADSLAPKYSFSGVSIRANFSGTSISIIMNDDLGDNYHNVLIDGQVHSIIRTTTGKKEYVLATDLEDREHEIEIFKRTELSFGKNQFYGFILDEGKTLAPIVNERELFIEYIGNSITCGYGNEGVNGDDFMGETENHFLTYAAVTSRNFNARHMAVSRSGIGIYRNYSGPIEGNDDCMTNLYTNTFLYDDNPKYDFAVQPDVVCINLGTNDFSTNDGDSALYTDNYFRLIDTIQTKYDMPEIVILLGSMMPENILTNVRPYLQFIAETANDKGKGNVTFFEMSAQTGDLGVGVHYHPTVAQHQRNAGELTEYISTLKDWDIQTLIQEANIISTQQIKVTFNTAINHVDEDYAGFSLSIGSTNYTIKSISADEDDATILNFTITEQLSPSDEIYLNYTPGTLSSEAGVELKPISNLKVNNALTQTSINDADVKSNGASIKLKFNKNLSPDGIMDGLSFSTNNNTIAIDSFSIKTKYLTCYINPIITSSNEVFFSYNGTGILGEDGIILEGYTNIAVDNGSSITSINSPIYNEQFKIWPNPNKEGIFNYQTTQSDLCQYVVVNAKGSIISQGKFDNPEGQFNLNESATCGVYFMKIYTSNQVETHELVIIN